VGTAQAPAAWCEFNLNMQLQAYWSGRFLVFQLDWRCSHQDLPEIRMTIVMQRATSLGHYTHPYPARNWHNVGPMITQTRGWGVLDVGAAIGLGYRFTFQISISAQAGWCYRPAAYAQIRFGTGPWIGRIVVGRHHCMLPARYLV
jgi:hypothetical protein